MPDARGVPAPSGKYCCATDGLDAAYKVSDREFETIEHCIMGLSNRGIGSRLSISERTVDTHMVNIYGKLGVKNKVELMTLAAYYHLVKW